MATFFPQTLARLLAPSALAFGLANAVHAVGVAGAAPQAAPDAKASTRTLDTPRPLRLRNVARRATPSQRERQRRAPRGRASASEPERTRPTGSMGRRADGPTGGSLPDLHLSKTRRAAGAAQTMSQT